MTETGAEALRRSYAKRLLAYGGISDNSALLDAFSRVPRERFLGPPPWRMLGFGRRPVEVGPDDLENVYQDVLFVLDADKGINNGEPSLHALLIDALGPKPGEFVVHVGAGTGYYTALLAELVGPTGHVLAVEADARLGELVQQNLGERENVEIVIGDGAEHPQGQTDGVYVSFAVAAPAANWVEHLVPGGRLVFPLGVPERGRGSTRYSDRGAMFRIERKDAGFAATFLCPVSFIFGVGGAGAADDDLTACLGRAFRSGNVRDVRSLVWRAPADPDRCWFHSEEWSLCYDPPQG